MQSIQITRSIAATITFALLGPLVSGQVAADSIPGLVAWWEAEGDAQDSVGGSHGSAVGGASYGSGKFGQAFSFDGLDDFIGVSPASNMDFGEGDFSISVWINLDTLSQGSTDGIREILHKVKGLVFQDAQTYFLEYRSLDHPSSPGSLRFGIGELGGLQNDLLVTANLTAGVWHHVAAVRELNTSRLYLDGCQIGSLTNGNSVDTGSGGVARIGNIAPNGVSTPRFFDGRIDETALYARALSAEEIQALAGQAPVSYCTAGISASGCQASMAATGLASASASSGFTLTASNVEGSKDGLFFFGTNGPQANPWGNGSSFQCVTPPVKRGGLLAGVGTSGACDGSFAQDLNALWNAFPGKNPGSGAVVQAQTWYRDPANTSNQTTSLSDALEFTVCP